MPGIEPSKHRVTVPDHVVYREFAAETVVLNLETGQYYGLNPMAGSMLQTAEAAPSIAAAVGQTATEYDQPTERVLGDLIELLETLIERGIVVLEPAVSA